MPPLPPLPEDNSPRGYILYTSGTLTHTMSFRMPSGTPFGTIFSVAQEIATDMLPLMAPIDSITTVEASNEGSNIRFPIGIIGAVGTGAPATDNDLNRTAALSIPGKGTDGRLVTVSFYSLEFAQFVDGRLPIGVVSAPVANWYSAVTNNTVQHLVNIGKAAVNWHAYLNNRRDAYWQRRQR